MISQGPSICIFNKKDPQQVLASWIFAQYLLTNEVQIAYSETEGYVPVTQKARDSAEYLDYLAKEGTDEKDHYEVKLWATMMLMENTSNTFVTAVFNGSASVRDAAGQLVENVTKAVRRKKTVDDAYIEDLYDEVIALYHLDQRSSGAIAGEKKDLGPLPLASKLLFAALALTWIIIGCLAARKYCKK